MTRGDDSVQSTTSDAQTLTIETVVAAFRADPAAPRPLSQMADMAGWSPFHFSRVFRAVVGVSPGAFHAALRIERAKHLLLTTDLPVTEVCFEVGYDGLGSFTTRFTRLVGVPPGRLRRLPELVAPVLASLPGALEPRLSVSPPSGSGITGRIVGGAENALVFVGAFPNGIAQGVPMAGTVRSGSGDFRLGAVPDGRYRLLAVALPTTVDPVGALLPAPTLVGAAPSPVEVRRGRAERPVDVVLRPPLPTDGPVLVALPALLLHPADARR
jgi:AraC-like DNA-binding protein